MKYNNKWKKKKKNYILGTIKNIEMKGFGPFFKKKIKFQCNLTLKRINRK